MKNDTLAHPICDECRLRHEDGAFSEPCDRHENCTVSASCRSMFVIHTAPDDANPAERGEAA